MKIRAFAAALVFLAISTGSASALTRPRYTYPAAGPDNRPAVYLLGIRDQTDNTWGICVATGLGDRTLATASHCLRVRVAGQWQWRNVNDVFVVDYQGLTNALAAHGQNPAHVFGTANIRNTFVHARATTFAGYERNNGPAIDDFSLITVDANVSRMRISCSIPAVDERVTMVGFATDYVKKESVHVVSSNTGTIELASGFAAGDIWPQLQGGDSGGPLLVWRRCNGQNEKVWSGTASGDTSNSVWNTFTNHYANVYVQGAQAGVTQIFQAARTRDASLPVFPCQGGGVVAGLAERVPGAKPEGEAAEPEFAAVSESIEASGEEPGDGYFVDGELPYGDLPGYEEKLSKPPPYREPPEGDPPPDFCGCGECLPKCGECDSRGLSGLGRAAGLR